MITRIIYPKPVDKFNALFNALSAFIYQPGATTTSVGVKFKSYTGKKTTKHYKAPVSGAEGFLNTGAVKSTIQRVKKGEDQQCQQRVLFVPCGKDVLKIKTRNSKGSKS